MTKTVVCTILAVGVAGTLSVGCDKDKEASDYGSEGRDETNEPKAAAPGQPGKEERAEQQTRPDAIAELKAAEGGDIEGKIELYSTPGGVRVVADVQSAPPGKHGFHIHEKGDCSDVKGESMGGHFAPEGHKHALPGEAYQRHLGDLGNLDVDDAGKGKLSITIEDANLKDGDPLSFVGKAVVVHSGEDSGERKQPSGGSGTPIACGVIERN